MSSSVGAITIPVAAGASLSAATDTIVAGILDFFAFTLKTALDAKLAALVGTSADACPVANRFPYSQGTWWPRNPVPALYVTWEGKSRPVPDTLVYNKRIRELSVFYVFDEIYAPDGLDAREALMALADSALATASSNGRHPSYTPPGGTAGQLLSWAIAEPGMLAWEYTGGEYGRMMPVPMSDAKAGGDGEGANVRFYPCLQGRVEVHERVGLDVSSDPADVNGDTLISIRVDETGEAAEPLEIISGVIAPYYGDPLPQDS